MPNIERNWTEDQVALAWVERYRARPRIALLPNKENQTIASSDRIKLDTAWAFNVLDSLIRDEPYTAWKIILLIHSVASGDEHVLANLAAGPLESLLAGHGRDAIAWVEHEARRSDEFKRLLRNVWKNLMPELIWQRVQKAAGD